MSLEEGKTETPEEGRWERRSADNRTDGIPADPEDPIEDLAPGIVLLCEEMDPAVKSRYGDLPVIAEFSNRAGAVQISEKDSQDKAQGIGTERDEDIREERMCVSAGLAEETRDR